MRRDTLSAELVRTHLVEYIKSQGHDPPGYAVVGPLANSLGMDSSYLGNLSMGRNRTIQFDYADRIFCAIGDPVYIWRSSPELAEAYERLPRISDEISPATTRRHFGGRKAAEWNTVLAIQMFRDGRSYQEISDEVGVDAKLIRDLMSRRGLVEKNQLGHRAQARSYDYAEALRLHEGGLSWGEVADHLGVKPNSLRAAMNRVKRGEAKAA